MMRKKEFPHLYIKTSEITEIAMIEPDEAQIKLVEPVEQEAKATCIIKDYDEEKDEEDEEDKLNQFKRDNINVDIKIEPKKKVSKENALALLNYNPEDDYRANDPYQIKKREKEVVIDEEMEKNFMEINQQINNERKLEEKQKIQKEQMYK